MADCAGSSEHETSFEDPVPVAGGPERLDPYPSDPPGISEAPSGAGDRRPSSGDWPDEVIEAGLRRVLTAIDGLPPKVDVRPADRDDFDCSPYPEGDGRHDYRKTASSYDGTGLDHPDYRDGETCWRCRRCGDVFVLLDAEMRNAEEDPWS